MVTDNQHWSSQCLLSLTNVLLVRLNNTSCTYFFHHPMMFVVLLGEIIIISIWCIITYIIVIINQYSPNITIKDRYSSNKVLILESMALASLYWCPVAYVFVFQFLGWEILGYVLRYCWNAGINSKWDGNKISIINEWSLTV